MNKKELKLAALSLIFAGFAVTASRATEMQSLQAAAGASGEQAGAYMEGSSIKPAGVQVSAAEPLRAPASFEEGGRRPAEYGRPVYYPRPAGPVYGGRRSLFFPLVTAAVLLLVLALFI